jgi:hypothetical protein
MQADPLIEAVRRIVRRVLDDEDRIDYRALYPGRVVVQDGPGGQVDILCDDSRVGSKVGVPLAPVPGVTLYLSPGTRCLLGWLGGDERFPRVFPAWDGSGGAVSRKDEAAASVAIVAPAVNLGTDPGGAFVMLATASTAQTTLFAAFAAAMSAQAAAFAAIGAALGGAAAVACAAAASASTAAATAVTTYAAAAATYIATRVKAT